MQTLVETGLKNRDRVNLYCIIINCIIWLFGKVLELWGENLPMDLVLC